jgi:hypothetical protein
MSPSKRMDHLNIVLNSRSALHEYCDRVRELAHDLAIELQMSSSELRARLEHTAPVETRSMFGALGRKWTAKKVAAGLWLASELAVAIGTAAIKVPLMFDQYYVGVTADSKKGVLID